MASGSGLPPSQYWIEDTTMIGAPITANIVEHMKLTGYHIVQENDRRKYGGPPPNWTGPAPGKGCEVFVGKIPRHLYEDELIPVFEICGQIYELRLMMNFDNCNRRYAFIKYTTTADAQRAQQLLNNYEICMGCHIRVCISNDNCRLYVGGIPECKTKEEILDEMMKVTEGAVYVIVSPSSTNMTENRGFAFVEYQSHQVAARARRKLISRQILIWNRLIYVDWAKPMIQFDEEVKVLFVRNLKLSTSEESLLREFCKLKGSVKGVRKIRDFAFIYFTNRDDALQAMHVMNNYIFEGARIEIMLAKPTTTCVRYTRTAGRGEPMVRGVSPGISYPGDRINEHGFSLAARDNAGPPIDMMEDLTIADRPESFSCRPRFPSALPESYFDPMNRIGMRCSAAGMRGDGVMWHPNSMGLPVYKPMRARKLCQVSIPGKNIEEHPTHFQPQKMCQTVKEARILAAKFVLGQLDIPIDTATAGDPVSIPTPYTQQGITQGAGNEHMFPKVPQGPAADHVPATNYQFVPPMSGK